MATNLISSLATTFRPYITFEGIHPCTTYDYRKRGFVGLPTLLTRMHMPKCKPGSWLYVVVPENASLVALADDEKLYIGSQSQDRMFRGDNLAGTNFHHAEMRKGNGADNLVSYMRSGCRAQMYIASENDIATTVKSVEALKNLAPLMCQPSKHPAYWFEQFVLAHEGKDWRWNTAGASAAVKSLPCFEE